MVSLKPPSFDGKDINFANWYAKFVAYGEVHRFGDALTATKPTLLQDVAADPIHFDETNHPLAVKQYKANALAMANLTMAFTNDNNVCMGFVFKSMDNDWPKGRAWYVMEKLEKKYRPNDLMVEFELNKKLSELKMNIHESPAVLFTQLASIDNWYPKDLPEEKVLPALMAAFPKESYRMVLSQYSMSKGKGTTSATLEDVEEQLVMMWRAYGGKSDGSMCGKVEDEVVMASAEIECYKCRRKGHKANKCPDLTTPSFQGNCNLCGKRGHKKEACWNDEKNAAKRPAYWRNGTGSANTNRNETSNTGVEVLMHGIDEVMLSGLEVPNSLDILQDPDIWIGDTGATVHSTPHDIGFGDVHDDSTTGIVVANGEKMPCAKVGTIKGSICDKEGHAIYESAALKDVVYVKQGTYNLFSVTKMVKDGWALYGDVDKMELKKGDITITFDIKINTAKGVLYGLYFKRTTAGNTEMGQSAIVHGSKDKSMSVDKAHSLFGHSYEEATRATAKALGITLTRGAMKPCLACSISKAKQKNVTKCNENHVIATKNELRIFIDLAWFKQPLEGPHISKRFWRMMVDERTQFKTSDFYETKNGMVVPTVEKLFQWKEKGLYVKWIRCDNAGENLALQTTCVTKDWKLNIEFEFTARDTPQHNYLVERGFPVIAAKAKAMMTAAHVPMSERYLIFREAINTATMLDGLIVECVDGTEATRYQHFYGVKKNPAWAAHLRTWGEAGTVKTVSSNEAKLADRGTQCMFVGYATDHAGDVYRMYDPDTKRVHITRDVIWLKRMYFQPKPKEEIVVTPLTLVLDETAVEEQPAVLEDDEEAVIISTIENANNNDVDNTDNSTDNATNSDVDNTANSNTLDQFSTTDDSADDELAESESEQSNKHNTANEQFDNNPFHMLMDDDDEDSIGDSEDTAPDARQTVTRSGRTVKRTVRFIEEMGMAEFDAILSEFTLVGAGIGGGFDHTEELRVMNYKKAMLSNDRLKWKQAIKDEHARMVKNNVWRAVKRNTLPQNTKILSSTWAMKKKADGTYRARVVARGYEQVEGKHYFKDFISSPVVNDVTIRLLLILLILGNMYSWIIDINGAFLLGLFQAGELLYMFVPDGMEEYYEEDDVLLLLRTLYGLKQAAAAFWKELLQCMTNMGFTRSDADPCLYFKNHDAYGYIFIISWVDDLLIIGSKEGVEWTKTKLNTFFDCDDIGEMKEYVGCKIERRAELIKLTQPVLIQSFIDEFNVDQKYKPGTPAEPGSVLANFNAEQSLNKVQQKKYRSGVGKLLHLMRWSRPDILNAVRELSKYMMSACEAHFKAMYRCMSYCVGSINKGLVLKPNGNWNDLIIRGESDANYATDLDNRRSVSGYAVFLNDAPVSFKSIQQRVVTLSTTEAELYSIVQCAQEMLFVQHVMESIDLKVSLPMKLSCDNKGAILLANNWSIGGRTRHIEVKQYFLRDLKELKILLCEWRSSEHMSVDIFTKNTTRSIFEFYLPVYVD